MSDSATMALTLWENRESDFIECVMKSKHAQYLSQIGFDEDIIFCCNFDVSTVVPMLVRENSNDILRSVSGSARPYPKPSEAKRISQLPAALKKPDPFEELLTYTKKPVRRDNI